MAIKIKKSDLNRKYTLVTGDGGEADIYNYSDKYLLKVFKGNVDLDMKERKVDALLQSDFIPGVVSPVDKVYIDNIFKSYIMENVKDAEIIASLAKKKTVKLLKITNKDLVGLMLDCSIKLEKIHKSNQVVGDISENNILVKLINNLYTSFYIDTDSFGIKNLPATTYTEIYTDPSAYGKNNTIKLDVKTDMYAFAILAFKILTRMHPFNGTYKKDKDMNTVKRMEKRISVLGKHDIIIPKIIPCWNWISPDLLNTFYEIFEKGKRCYITDLLKDLYDNMEFCNKHGNYYYSKYSSCPVCDSNAKVEEVNKMPTVVKANKDRGSVSLYVVLSNDNIQLVLDFDKYVDKLQNVVHVTTKNTWGYKRGANVEFSKDGNYVFEIYNDRIDVYETKTKNRLSSVKRAHRSHYSANENSIYYIDTSRYLSKLEITKYGLVNSRLVSTYANTLIEVDKTGKYFAAILYPKEMTIVTDSTNLTLKYDGKIHEYAIKYDRISKNWLFIYETSKGEHRTVVISDNKVIYDKKIYRYNAYPLSNICFANNTIFSPSHKKIVGINYKDNIVKNFELNVITEESTLEFENGGFNIVTDNKIYRYAPR